MKETLEEAAECYAHNYFEMHETNNYKALKQGFEAGAKWHQENILQLLKDNDYQDEPVFELIEKQLKKK